ncbi:alpha-xylosidase [Alicyclobacillus shizuokensis]|uniref:alpha-xylosidase n=1 Tax=Alicyclobacillus shizuokensis TaxID=392014 RepID=UPI000834C346|nr:alpha-xylosidase [Alicyclobacillus shizuokensis]
MKFSNGNWLNRAGVTMHLPAEVHTLDRHDNALTLYAPCQHIAHRGATLQGPLLTIHLSSPMANVIRVRIEHFRGTRDTGPRFELCDGEAPVSVAETDEQVSLTSGSLTVQIAKRRFRMDFFGDGRRLTGSGSKAMAYIRMDDRTPYVKEELDLSVGECVYGLGERFGPFVKNGQVVDIWNEDGGTGSEQAYKNIPFYLTNRGYGVFVNHPEHVGFEVASEKVSRVQFSVTGEALEYFVIYGPSPKDVIRRYTDLTGKPALPPAWSFGLWLSTSFTTDYDEQTVNHFVDGMAEREIPLSVFHFDCFWMKEFEWCNFEWDERVFPDPEGMLQRLKERGLHVCVWINPYIGQKSPLFDEAAARGFLLKRPNGDVWQWDLWQPGMGLVDFTNPEARAWFQGKLERLLDMGVDCFKTDFGERIPTDVVYYDGADPVKMHNYYTYLYNQTVFELLQRKRGEREAVVFARSATVGGQKFPVHWGGDCYARYESMAESLRGGLSLGACGFGYWSHDIGGFEETATADVYKRWIAFGLLSSHSRLHGSSSYRVPWLFDEEAVDVLRHFTTLKLKLMPYLYGQAVTAHEQGVPMMRAMFLEFPGDPACDTLDRQYMLGDSLLVAPVFSEDGRVDYYLPDGLWTHYLTGEQVVGGRWLQACCDYFNLPLFVRGNSIVAAGARTDTAEYDYTDGVCYEVFALEDGRRAEATVYAPDTLQAVQAVAERRADRIDFRVDGASKPWIVLLNGVQSVDEVEGGRVERTERGVRIVPEDGASYLAIRLAH